MAGEVELERMIVRILGDVGPYIASLEKAAAATKTQTMDMSKLATSAHTTMVAGMSEAGRAQQKVIDEQAAAMKRGEDVTRAAMTAQERYVARHRELNDLLKRGAITQETHSRALTQASQGILGATSATDSLNAALTSTLGVSLGVASAVGTVAAVIGTLKAAFDAFSEAEAIGIRLEATLEAQGRDVEATRARYEAFAKELEKVSTLEDDFVLSLLATAEGFNLTGAGAEKAVRDAAALAAAKGGSAETYLRFTAAMAKGDLENAMSMKRLIHEIKDVQTEAELLDRYNKIVTAGLAAQAKQVETTAGKFTILKRDVMNALEPVGGIVSDQLQPLADVLNFGAQQFKSFTEKAYTASQGLKEYNRQLMEAAQVGGGALGTAGAAFEKDAAAAGVKVLSFDDAKALDEFTKKLEKEALTFGMTADEAEIFNFKMLGATEQQLAAAEAAAEVVACKTALARAYEESAAAAAKLNGEAADLAKNMEAEIATFGMSAEAAKIFRMEMEGLDEALAGHLRGLAEQKKALEDGQKLMEEGQRVTEQVLGKDPTTKYAAEVEKLNKLKEAGAISERVYAMGVKQAGDELDKAGQKAQQALAKFDAARSGSAEALSRLAAFRDQLATGRRAEAAPSERLEAVQRGGAEANQRGEKQIEELKGIRGILQRQADRPVLVVKPADFS